jgi:tetratricopeptide (TPR) repeat protein
MVGCGEDRPVELRYDRPAVYEIPASVKKLAIAEFGGKSEKDLRWGDIASDKLADALEQANRTFERYQLVDRKRLKAIMDERDLQISIADSASAGKAGKLANVDAMIYGNVNVMTRDEHATRQVYDFASKTTKTVPYIKRYCMVAVNFTMDDIQTSKTLTTVSVTREYDSENDKNKSGTGMFLSAMGMGGDKLPPVDQKINSLVEECVTEFLQRISPHTVVVSERLQKGKSKIVDTGNKLALAKEYAEALDCYLQGIEAKPDDHGAMFDAGLMYEAMGKLDKAEELYTKAFKLKDNEKYIFARKRVRTEATSGFTNGKAVKPAGVKVEQAPSEEASETPAPKVKEIKNPTPPAVDAGSEKVE